jgi:SAM-dependent methyltransferase
MPTSDTHPDRRHSPSTALGASVAAEDLEMARRKRRSVAISAAYRAKQMATRVLGPARLLRWCLDASWMLKRFAFELSGSVYGDEFHNAALALSDDFLQRWIPPRGSLVDIGCGTGRWCRAAKRHADRVVGIDLSEDDLAMARERSDPAIEYIRGDVGTVLGAERFDVTLMVNVLEHVDDPEGLLRTALAISRRLIAEVPDLESDPLNVVRRVVGSPWYVDADHVREYTLDTLRGQLERSGWRIAHQEQRGGAILVVADPA